MDDKIFCYAGSDIQCKTLSHRLGIKLIYVFNETSIRGMRDKIIFYYGTYYMRKDVEKIVQIAKLQNMRQFYIEDKG